MTRFIYDYMKELNNLKLSQVVLSLVLNNKTGQTISVTPLLDLFRDLETFRNARGTLDSIYYHKYIRTNLLNFLSGNSERNTKSTCSKDRVPTSLISLIPYVIISY